MIIMSFYKSIPGCHIFPLLQMLTFLKKNMQTFDLKSFLNIELNVQFTLVNVEFTHVNVDFTFVNVEFTFVNVEFTHVKVEFTLVNVEFTL